MITALLLLVVGLAVTAVIIAANGYFVAQEFAYMSVDRAGLRARAEAGDRSARRALRVTRRTSFMLSGAQLGITITGLLVGYVAEPLIGESVGTLLGGAGVPAAVGIAIGTTGALVLATVVQIIFAELYPKNLAIAAPEPLARGLARSTLIYLGVFGWLIRFFDASSNAVLKLVGVAPVHDVDSSATAEDLERIIDDSRESGDLPEELSLLLDRALDFPDRDVEHAMIPRVHVAAFARATTVAQCRAAMAEGHTRYPVIDDEDEPVGVVHLVDVLGLDADDPRPISEIMRAPVILPTLMKLPHALQELSRADDELACVIDEYGGFAGVLTVEDVAEELVGEIGDEHDDEDVDDVSVDADGVWTLNGDLHVDEVERLIGDDLPRGDYETTAGMIIGVAGRLPQPGEIVRIPLPVSGADIVADGETITRTLEAEIVTIDRHVPEVIRLRLVDDAAEDADADSARSADPDAEDRS